MTDSAALVVAAMVGLVVGSFLNVCVHRLPRQESVAWPGSHCPQCGHAIAWYDNIPVVSYLWLRGRCRYCRAGIPIRYLLVEIATAALFVTLVRLFPPGLLLASRLVFGCALIVLFVIDMDHRILPNIITVTGIPVGFVFGALSEPGWRSSLIGIVAGGGIPMAIALLYERIRGHEGLGMGDVKMLAMIGAFLGWQRMLLTLFLGSFLGSIVGVIFIMAGKGAKYALPFGTFLAIGALATIVVGDRLLAWYLAQF